MLDMLKVNMECGIVVKDIPDDLNGGDNFKPIFLPKAVEIMIKNVQKYR